MKAFVICVVIMSALKIGQVVGSQKATDEEAATGCVLMAENVAVAAWGVYLLFFAR